MVSEDSRNPFLIRPGESTEPAEKAAPAEAPPVESGTRRIASSRIPAALPFVSPPLAPMAASAPPSTPLPAHSAPATTEVPPAPPVAPDASAPRTPTEAPEAPAPPDPALRIEDLPAPLIAAEAGARPVTEPLAPVAPTSPTPVVTDAPTTIAEPEWQLRLPGGDVVLLEDALLIGRNPAPRADAPGATLLAVDDPERTVSKTHARLIVEDGAVIVTDLSSTNGTSVQLGDEVIVLGPGEQYRVDGAAAVLFGSFPVQLERATR